MSLSHALEQEMSHLEKMAHWYTGNPEDAEDLMQDTCVLALRFGDSFSEGSNFRGWLFRVMRNRYVSILRRRQLEKRVLEEEERHCLKEWSIGEMGRKNMKPSGGIEKDDGFSDTIQHAMDSLKPEFREIIWLCDVEDKSYLEAAEIVQRPIGTVMSRLHRGRRILRKKIGSKEQLQAA